MFYKNAISWDLPTIYSSREQEKSFKLNFNHQEVHEVPRSKIQKGGRKYPNNVSYFIVYTLSYILPTPGLSTLILPLCLTVTFSLLFSFHGVCQDFLKSKFQRNSIRLGENLCYVTIHQTFPSKVTVSKTGSVT